MSTHGCHTTNTCPNTKTDQHPIQPKFTSQATVWPVVITTLALLAMLRQRARRRLDLLTQSVIAEWERRVWGRSQTVAILDAMLPTVHPYATRSTANIYRHFDRRNTLEELEKDYPPGPKWRSQFRFDRV